MWMRCCVEPTPSSGSPPPPGSSVLWLSPNVLPLAATHDIELSYILEDCYDNYHFEEEIRDNDVIFNYQLKEGRATTRNAIRLLELIGYDPKIVRDAREAARRFEEIGVWS